MLFLSNEWTKISLKLYLLYQNKSLFLQTVTNFFKKNDSRLFGKKLKQEEFCETVLDLRRCSKNPEILRFSGWEYEPEYD